MKRVFLDGGSLTHFSIFGWESQYRRHIESYSKQNNIIFELAKVAIDELIQEGKLYISQPHYLYFQSLISLFKRIGISKEDIVYICNDGRNSWRKAFYLPYKEHREAFRKSYDLIDWSFRYGQINKVVSQIDEAIDFHIVWMSGIYNFLDLLNTSEGEKFLDIEQINSLETEFGLEADDIIACGVKLFGDNDEIIIISKDADLEQLCVKSNVKFFSMNLKYNGGIGLYKSIGNGYKILDKKIEKGDKSDNILVDKENDTERDKEIRKLIIDLINLPTWVSKPIENILRNLPQKTCDFSKLPFPNSLALRFPQIYSSDKIITYEECLKRLERKEVRAKNKKIKLKKEQTMRKLTKEK